MAAKVSIVLCTYNGAKYIKEQLDSILSQTYPLYEIIVQDDDSIDETVEIINEYATKNPLIKVYKNESGHGVNGNFLSAMQRATGDFVAISDQDDIWEPTKIEQQVHAIGDKMLCSGFSRPFSDDGSFAYFDKRHRNTHLLRMLFLCLPGHTLLFRRELIDMLPPLQHPIFTHSMYDAALCIIASAQESIVFIDEILVNFRRHADATTYSDYHKSLPSWHNAINNLWWGATHFGATRKKARLLFNSKLELLRYIKVASKVAKTAERVMELELKKGVLPFLELQYLFAKNYKHLFHTEGSGVLRLIRALLYPIMQLHMYAD